VFSVRYDVNLICVRARVCVCVNTHTYILIYLFIYLCWCSKCQQNNFKLLNIGRNSTMKESVHRVALDKCVILTF